MGRDIFRRDGFYKSSSWQKKKIILVMSLILAILFFSYQFLFMSQLTNTETNVIKSNLVLKLKTTSRAIAVVLKDVFDNRGLIRGIRLKDLSKYKPNSQGMFTCFKSGVEIDFSLVNDDYCDCPEDGSDEPGTNACNQGHFYCKYQPKYKVGKNFVLVIPSNKVNDGICDCCDGSDEWNKTNLLALPKEDLKKLGRFLSPCPNICMTS